MADDPTSWTALLSLLGLSDVEGVRCCAEAADGVDVGTRRLRIDIGAGPSITLLLYGGDFSGPAWFRGEQLSLAYGRPGDGSDPLADPARGRILRSLRRRVEAHEERIDRIIARLIDGRCSDAVVSASASAAAAVDEPAVDEQPRESPHESLCVLAWNSLHAGVDRTISTCCLVTTPLRREDGEPFRLGRDQLVDVWRSEDLARFRRAFAAGERPDVCDRCWQTEAAGGQSKRLGAWRNFPWAARYAEADEPRLEALDLNLDNRCNLACRTCGPEDSSAWEAEAAHQAQALAQASAPAPGAAPSRAPFTSWSRDPIIWEGIDALLPELRHLDLLGGEPFLIRAQFDFLQRCVDCGEAGHITLSYNTNGTLMPARGRELWPHFAAVRIGLSIDAVGERFEYLRYPAKWPKVLQVIDELRSLSYLDLDCRVTCSLYNILYLPELHDWATEAHLPYSVMPCDPSCFSVHVLPPEAKRAVRQRLEAHPITGRGDAASDVRALLAYMDARDGYAEHFEMFRRLTALGDAYRNEHFERTFPELSALLDGSS